jgi:hypothetical protein
VGCGIVTTGLLVWLCRHGFDACINIDDNVCKPSFYKQRNIIARLFNNVRQLRRVTAVMTEEFCIIARIMDRKLPKVTRSYCLGCISPVKDRRLLNVLGMGAGRRILSGMSSDLGLFIEAIGRFVSLTARILLTLRNPDVAVADLDFRFIQIEWHIGVLGHSWHFHITLD